MAWRPLVLGAAAVVTAPIWALSVVAATVAPPPAYAPAPVYAAPPAYYAAPPTYYSAPPPSSYQPSVSYAPARSPRVQREVVDPDGRYVLCGDGVSQPWHWVRVWAATPPSPPPALQSR